MVIKNQRKTQAMVRDAYAAVKSTNKLKQNRLYPGGSGGGGEVTGDGAVAMA